MKIGITGASGMLGTALVACLSKKHDIFATSRNQGVKGKNIEWDCFDLTNITLLNKWLDKIKPNLIIHCAAIDDVDACEDDVETATKLHFETTKFIAEYLERNNDALIYISTDSVFDGKKQTSYRESDVASPLNVYAKTKFMGEEPVQSMSKGLVLRTNIVGWTQEGNNSFAEWILESLINNTLLNLFHDVYFTPLHIDKLTLIINNIIENPIYGLYHCASKDRISKYNFGVKMAKIFHFSGSNINKVSVKEVDLKAERPKNMALDIEKIDSTMEYDFPNVADAIELMKHQYDNNNQSNLKKYEKYSNRK